jgi:hypothetical protein
VVPRSIFFLAAHGDAELENLGNIMLYGGDGSYRSFSPGEVERFVRGEQRVTPDPGSRGLKLVILSVCSVQKRLSSYDLAVDPVGKAAWVASTPSGRAKYGPSWLESVFLNRIAIGWKGKPVVPRVYQVWSESFFPALANRGGRTGQTIEKALEKCNWGKPIGTPANVWPNKHLVVRTLPRRTENAQGEDVCDNFYYYNKWIPRASTGRDN